MPLHQELWRFNIKCCNSRKKASRTLRTLYPILSSSDLTQRQKTVIYTSIIQAQILYACQAWGHTSKTKIHKLQVLQNRAALTITGADRFTRITQLHEMLNHDKIQARITHLARKTRETYITHENTLIQQIGQSQHSTKLHYRKPTQIIE